MAECPKVKKTTTGSYKAYYAGVLPFTIDPRKKGINRILFLLGQEHNNTWSGFGGLSEESDRCPMQAAARECFEESMGIFGSTTQIYNKLTTDMKMVRHSHKLKGHTYLMKIPYDSNLPLYFRRVYRYFYNCSEKIQKSRKKGAVHVIPSCPHGYYEKTNLKWVSALDLLEMAADTPLQIAQKASVRPPPGLSQPTSLLNLRPPFRDDIVEIIKLFDLKKGEPL